MRAVESDESGLADIARDFFTAFDQAGRIARRFRSGELRFPEVERFVDDGETSPLFRLKERSHALFRKADPGAGLRASAEALFDLAVGALFHEAMKFRENFYQEHVYGPKVRALRASADDPEAVAMFGEFEKILAATSVRLEESLQETEALLEQTRRQFARLLSEHRGNGVLTRYLVENPELVRTAFPRGLDALLADIHGSAGAGWLAAARSYLASGFFDLALGALREAERDEDLGPEPGALRAYAEGMNAYLDGDMDEALELLSRWLEGPAASIEPPYARLAHAAATRIAASEGGQAERAGRLTERLEDLGGLAAAPA
jgi:hypothetical protein